MSREIKIEFPTDLIIEAQESENQLLAVVTLYPSGAGYAISVGHLSPRNADALHEICFNGAVHECLKEHDRRSRTLKTDEYGDQ